LPVFEQHFDTHQVVQVGAGINHTGAGISRFAVGFPT
jgi:hypothetical protein